MRLLHVLGGGDSAETVPVTGHKLRHAQNRQWNQRGIELPRRNILCPSLGRSRLNVDSMYSLAEANQKFVRDSTGLLCNLLRAEDMAAARPVDQNLAE